MTPLNKADHAARFPLVGPTLIGSWPRVALSLNAVVNRSNNNRSRTGAVLVASNEFALPVQFVQVTKPTFVLAADLSVNARMFVALRKTVCHGVPRCTRPSQPTVGNLFVGKSQSSDCHISGSLKARLNGLLSAPVYWSNCPHGW